MPALIFLRRKWLIACDDFVILSTIEAFLRIVWCITTCTLISLKIRNCQDFLLNDYFLYAAVADLLLTTCVALSIAFVSGQGSVLQVEKRKSLSYLLYVKIVTVLCDVAIASYGIWLFTQMPGNCRTKEIFVKITTVLAWIYVLILISGIIICFDSLGISKYWNIDSNLYSLNFFKKAQYIWKLRLKLFCCCADISEENDLIYVEISTFLASFLNGIDLVPTDILAGIIVLSQKHVLERRKYMLVHQPQSAEMLEKTPTPDWMNTENALYFLRIAKSTYGWIAFFNALNPCNLCTLASHARCFNCLRPQNENKIDNCCHLNFAAVQKISGFTESDIIYASFKNSIYEPAFYVAVDWQKKYIIIAICGTRSFSDIMTDVDGENLLFPFGGPNKFKCHRGALKSAMFVHKKLNELNILAAAFDENPSFILAITGHSLGGSAGALLALMLRPRYPTLQCYTYGPFAMVSASGIPETLDHTMTVVVGEDMSPRICIRSFVELREQIMESLRRKRSPKYKILLGACWYHIQKYFKMQPQRPVGKAYDNVVCENGSESNIQPDVLSTDEDLKLYAPGRILYFERKNWTNPYWLTGLNLQNIIVNPDMIADHQPHRIQQMLEKHQKSTVEISHL